MSYDPDVPTGRSKFQQLALTHAAMMGGEAAMVVALADSFFFDVDPNGARSKVLAFLLVSFAPFLVVAPLIGPMIDRARGGRRLVVQVVAALRIVIQLLMIVYSNSIWLFPLVFAALILQKSYAVAKSALVPSVVTNDHELVEANSKLGVIAGISGTIAVIPAAALQLLLGSGATLAYGAILFGVALSASLRLPRDTPVAEQPLEHVEAVVTPSMNLASVAMIILRAAVGFMLFFLAFWFRGRVDERRLLGLAVSMSALGTLAGNAIAPRVRSYLNEEKMLMVALALPAVAGVIAFLVATPAAGIGLAVVVNFSAALGRLSFESVIQRDGPAANRGQIFARFETRFQLGWVVAAVLPVMLEIPSRVGLALVAAVFAAAVFNYITGVRAIESTHHK